MKALIAMSGGVDSSVAAYLIKEQGYEVIGATMRLFSGEDLGITGDSKCCSLDDTEDARYVALNLGIHHYVFNYRKDFREKVIDKFIAAYENGETPNPCIDCNRYLKFRTLYDRAALLDCDYIVTGHYARIEEKDGRYCLKKAKDLSKDQSYVLYSLTQDQLAHTLFPLGELEKSETRRIAEEQGFLNADKKDSQDICFVPDGDYASVIQKFTGKEYPEGDFVDEEGNVLGRHRGIIHYTVGQRKGLGIALGKPMYVKSKDPLANRVVLAEDCDLFERELIAGDFNWVSIEKPEGEIRAKAKIRYNQKEEQPARIIPEEAGKVRIVFDEPQRAIAAGQAVCVYDGDYLLGGGTILG